MHERIDWMKRFFKLFSLDNIAYVTADREFIGRDWLDYLLKEKTPFRIRIRNNTQVRSGRSHRWMNVTRLFCGHRLQQARVLNKTRKVWGLDVYVIGLRTADGYVIVITNEAPHQAMADYKLRWNIEMLFSCLKKRGFDFERTHLSEPERVSKLLALLTVAFCWCVLQGETLAVRKELVLKKHGYVGKGLFRQGLELLSNLVSNISCKFKGFRDALQLFVL